MISQSTVLSFILPPYSRRHLLGSCTTSGTQRNKHTTYYLSLLNGCARKFLISHTVRCRNTFAQAVQRTKAHTLALPSPLGKGFLLTRRITTSVRFVGAVREPPLHKS